jgi:hypothetical protein
MASVAVPPINGDLREAVARTMTTVREIFEAPARAAEALSGFARTLENADEAILPALRTGLSQEAGYIAYLLTDPDEIDDLTFAHLQQLVDDFERAAELALGGCNG